MVQINVTDENYYWDINLIFDTDNSKEVFSTPANYRQLNQSLEADLEPGQAPRLKYGPPVGHTGVLIINVPGLRGIYEFVLPCQEEYFKRNREYEYRAGERSINGPAILTLSAAFNQLALISGLRQIK